MECPDCNIEMERVEGEVQRATPTSDAVWGEWMECPKCHRQEDIIPEDSDDYDN